MDDVEFTFDWYRTFLDRLLSRGFTFRAYADDLRAGDALLRHDIDLSPERAVEMARIERQLDVEATYFFLLGSPLYNPLGSELRRIVEEIASLGHDVGLHFSTHQYWDPDDPPDEATLAAHVRRERQALETVAPDLVPIVSFHIPPDWVLRREFDGFESTYEPRFFEEIEYVADSSQRWRDQAVLPDETPEKLQVLTHPGLWGRGDGSFVERVRSAVIEADRRATDYADSRYLRTREPEQPPTSRPIPDP